MVEEFLACSKTSIKEMEREMDLYPILLSSMHVSIGRSFVW